MPTDPFATRWAIISEALTFQANALAREIEEEKEKTE
jgi:hypothetical protein